MLKRIVQLTSAKTFDNGRMRFNDQGISGERQAVMSDFLPNIEKAGYKITAKIVSLWNNERDPKTLFGDLDEKSELLMRKLWRLLLIEEGEEVDEGGDLDSIFHPEAAFVAYVAGKYAAHKATPDVEAMMLAMVPRLEFHMQVVFCMQGTLYPDAKLLTAVVNKIYHGERDIHALVSELGGAKKKRLLDPKAFVRKVLSYIEDSDEATLEKKWRSDEALVDLVWDRPNFEGFFQRHSATFRRIVQLCDKDCALKYDRERIFPGDVENERDFVVGEYVPSWTAGNWHLEDAIPKLWKGVRTLQPSALAW